MSRKLPHARIVLAVAAIAAGPALAPGAGAQSSPFSPVPEASQPTTQQSTVVQTTNGNSNQIDDGFETWQAILVVMGGVILLTGIALAIMRDARRRAPEAAPDETTPQRTRDAHQSSQKAKQKQRQKDKAARAQRRHNR